MITVDALFIFWLAIYNEIREPMEAKRYSTKFIAEFASEIACNLLKAADELTPRVSEDLEDKIAEEMKDLGLQN